VAAPEKYKTKGAFYCPPCVLLNATLHFKSSFMHHAGKIIPLRRESMRETAWGLLLTAPWSSDIGQIYGILG
jgi:hypothetical protein